MSRTINSLRNIGASIGGQLLNNVFRFLCRTIFVYVLGKEYLGISSLYANILTILSVSELGFSTAITYSLYRPLVENDIPAIQSLMQFFKRAYRIIGLLILLVGLIIMPFLPDLMLGATDKINIYQYYLLYLGQTVISYLFFAYKGTLLIADQKKYIYDTVVCAVQIGMNLVQIVILLCLRSFLLYTIVAVVCDALQNVITSIVVDRKYPYLKAPAQNLSKERRREVFKQVYAASLYRICITIGTSTDNLIISSNISVLMVGLYDNYYMIVQVIHKLLQGFFQAFTSSLGNLYVLESRERNEFIFRCLNQLNNWVIVFCSVSFLMLFQPFIELWLGREYLLTGPVVLSIVINFATNYLQVIVQAFKNASGLFLRGKYRAVATAVLNLVISIILARYWGLTGVLWGSIISRMVTTWWYDAWIIYRYGFHQSPVHYFLECAVTMGLIFVITGVLELLCMPFSAATWGNLILKGMVCVLGGNGIYLLLYGRREEFRYLFTQGRNLICHRLAKTNQKPKTGRS